MKKAISDFLRHPLVVTIIGTSLFSLAGICLTDCYQRKAWERERSHALFVEKLNGGLVLIDELSEFISKRFFGLVRVNNVLKNSDTVGLNEVWPEYYDSVVEWNTKAMQYRGRLARYINSICADSFLNNPDAVNTYEGGQPNTIHGHFLRTHSIAKNFRDCLNKECSNEAKKAYTENLRSSLDKLGIEIEKFISDCTNEVYNSK